ncbi:PREDICTED: uncharacterized protein LOC108566985 [Nicrophorus vespilloides]|uniref:Uncharacterized protein LOC108566985 n=1 Tax=Nicrophorus vespilloides TaxID=110193 RepID=A0ABM1N745_NICVS|nr:PREDICTED: uncharacterized protein LOC108566985 [Nicrophorus vespilloides]
MDYKELASTIIHDHKYPIVKFEIDKTKLFRCSRSDKENAMFINKLNSLKAALRLSRVERRCARCKANWLKDKRLAHMTHLVGTKFQTMGFGNKEGKFLYPEEILFLLESNRAEVLLNNIPMNMMQAYQELLSSVKQVKIYQVYRELVFKGFNLIKHMPSLKINEVEDVREESENKRIKCDKEETNEMNEVFLRLQETGPKLNERVLNKECDFKLANSPLKIHVMFNKELDSKIGFYNDSQNNIYCGIDQEITFNTFTNFQIPFLAIEN